MGRALSQAGRRGGHTLSRRARLRHAPEPLHRLGQDRPPAGLHGRGDQRLTGGALAEWTTTRQDPRDPLRRPGSCRLNSPTVSDISQGARALVLLVSRHRPERDPIQGVRILHRLSGERRFTYQPYGSWRLGVYGALQSQAAAVYGFDLECDRRAAKALIQG